MLFSVPLFFAQEKTSWQPTWTRNSQENEKPKNKPRPARDPALTNEEARLVDDVAVVIDICLIRRQNVHVYQTVVCYWICYSSKQLDSFCIYCSDLLRVMFEVRYFVQAVGRVVFRCGRGHVMSVSQSRSSMRLWKYKSDRSRGAITWSVQMEILIIWRRWWKFQTINDNQTK